MCTFAFARSFSRIDSPSPPIPRHRPAQNGDGVVTLAEFQENLLPKTRKKIEMKLAAGWTFDAEKWKASCDRHAIGE